MKGKEKLTDEQKAEQILGGIVLVIILSFIGLIWAGIYYLIK
jgi:hypothetical protein